MGIKGEEFETKEKTETPLFLGRSLEGWWKSDQLTGEERGRQEDGGINLQRFDDTQVGKTSNWKVCVKNVFGLPLMMHCWSFCMFRSEIIRFLASRLLCRHKLGSGVPCLIDFSRPDWHSATNWRWQIEAKAGLGPSLKGINSGHGHPCVPPPAGIFTGELGRKKKTWCQSRWQRPRWSDSSAPPSDTCCTPPNICSIFPPRSISLGTNCTGGQAPQEGGRSWQWCGLEVWHCVRVAGSHGRHHARPRNPSGRLMGTGRSDAIPILGESGPSSS